MRGTALALPLALFLVLPDSAAPGITRGGGWRRRSTGADVDSSAGAARRRPAPRLPAHGCSPPPGAPPAPPGEHRVCRAVASMPPVPVDWGLCQCISRQGQIIDFHLPRQRRRVPHLPAPAISPSSPTHATVEAAAATPGHCKARGRRDDRSPVKTQDWAKLTADLERLLKLRSFVFAMKLFEKREEMEAIPRIRRPQSIHTFDQVVGQASPRLPAGPSASPPTSLVGAQVPPPSIGLLGNAKDHARPGSPASTCGRRLVLDRRGCHRASGGDEPASPTASTKAMAVAPLASRPPRSADIALFYATPGAMMYFINLGCNGPATRSSTGGIVGECGLRR